MSGTNVWVEYPNRHKDSRGIEYSTVAVSWARPSGERVKVHFDQVLFPMPQAKHILGIMAEVLNARLQRGEDADKEEVTQLFIEAVPS